VVHTHNYIYSESRDRTQVKSQLGKKIARLHLNQQAGQGDTRLQSQFYGWCR
jgi:hypothetical protein